MAKKADALKKKEDLRAQAVGAQGALEFRYVCLRERETAGARDSGSEREAETETETTRERRRETETHTQRERQTDRERGERERAFVALHRPRLALRVFPTFFLSFGRLTPPTSILVYGPFGPKVPQFSAAQRYTFLGVGVVVPKIKIPQKSPFQGASASSYGEFILLLFVLRLISENNRKILRSLSWVVYLPDTQSETGFEQLSKFARGTVFRFRIGPKITKLWAKTPEILPISDVTCLVYSAKSNRTI